MMKRTVPSTPAQYIVPHRPTCCYDRIVQEVAGNQRPIGGGVLVLAAVLVPGLLTAGCYYSQPAFTPPVPSNGIDAGADSDARSTGPDANVCFGTAPFRVCLEEAPIQQLSISRAETIDTASSPKCVRTDPDGSFGCVLAATTITVEAPLRAYGSRPLVLIASGRITIAQTGSIDVSSHRGPIAAQELGAGADQDCLPGQLPKNAGGGAGGSFAGLGGKGGGSLQFMFWMGGMPGPSVAGEINQLRGGCAGQNGGGSGSSQAPGGHGGGAVLLIAGQAIQLNGGAINAAGEGGEGGLSVPRGAGGGGGSGGMIVLDAPTIAGSGLILASGGGGGGGGSSNSSGTPGATPSAVSPPAAGGGGGLADGGTDGGRGGNGSTSDANAGGGDGNDGGTVNGGGAGGGGGGGTGIVKAVGASLGSQVSSPLQTP